ncbi:MAG: HIT domain-containing protein [archaeon]
MAGEPDFEKMSPEEISEYQRQNCIFCKIIKGEIPSRKAYEDDKMVAIMDINPAGKGHLLVMTKEHYPVLPLIPVEISAHMFRVTRDLNSALKKAMITNKSTIFMANGAVAGQQSPHFLYHIIPRESGDGLDNFNIPTKEVREEELQANLTIFKGKLGLMMKQFAAMRSQGKDAGKQGQQPQGTSQSSAPASPIPDHFDQKELARVIDSNPAMKEMIIKNPAEFKKELEKNPELKKLFGGLDIEKLSIALSSIK